MLKRISVVLAAVVLLAAACRKVPSGETRCPQTLLVYMAGNSNLSSYAYANIADLKAGYVPRYCVPGTGDVLLVYRHTADPDSLPRLLRLYRNARNEVVEEVVWEYDPHAALAPETMRRVLADAAERFPAEENGLVLWSHGTGWLPAGFYADPDAFPSGAAGRCSESFPDLDTDPMRKYVKSFGPDSGVETELEELAAALPMHYDYIIFDACLMAGVEVAYALREKTDYVLASAAEILAQGFPYREYVRPLLEGDVADLEGAARCYFNYYDRQNGLYRSATVSLTDTRCLEELAAACRPVFEAGRARTEELDMEEVQGFFRMNRHYFYDLDDYVRRIADPDAYARFRSALDRTVVYAAATPWFFEGSSSGFEIRTHCGLTSYVPNPAHAYLDDFYRRLSWNRASGLVAD